MHPGCLAPRTTAEALAAEALAAEALAAEVLVTQVLVEEVLASEAFDVSALLVAFAAAAFVVPFSLTTAAEILGHCSCQTHRLRASHTHRPRMTRTREEHSTCVNWLLEAHPPPRAAHLQRNGHRLN